MFKKKAICLSTIMIVSGGACASELQSQESQYAIFSGSLPKIQENIQSLGEKAFVLPKKQTDRLARILKNNHKIKLVTESGEEIEFQAVQTSTKLPEGITYSPDFPQKDPIILFPDESNPFAKKTCHKVCYSHCTED